MRNAHAAAAEQHELAAHAHRTAAEHNEKGNDEAGRWHADRALEYSNHAYRLAREAHNKSGQMETP
jgi:transposase InsO family protein